MALHNNYTIINGIENGIENVLYLALCSKKNEWPGYEASALCTHLPMKF